MATPTPAALSNSVEEDDEDEEALDMEEMMEQLEAEDQVSTA